VAAELGFKFSPLDFTGSAGNQKRETLSGSAEKLMRRKLNIGNSCLEFSERRKLNLLFHEKQCFRMARKISKLHNGDYQTTQFIIPP
jgi:hypothetical protein